MILSLCTRPRAPSIGTEGRALCREVIHGQFHVRRDTPRFPKRKYPAQAADAAGAPPGQVALPLAFHGGPSSLPLVKAGERCMRDSLSPVRRARTGRCSTPASPDGWRPSGSCPTPGAAAPPPSSSPTMGTIRPGQSGLRHQAQPGVPGGADGPDRSRRHRGYGQ